MKNKKYGSLFVALLFRGGSFGISVEAASLQGGPACHSLFSCQPVTWRDEKKNPQEVVAPKIRVAAARVPTGPIDAYSSVPANAKNPNSIRIALSAAPPILSETKIVNGKKVCAHKRDKPVKSKKNHKGKIHVDEQCCLDPDEIPNPRCYYPELGR